MKKFFKTLLASTLIVSALVGCSSQGTTDTTSGTDTQSTETSSDISGSITMNGSTSMEKLANSLSEVFMQKYPGVTVTAQFTGSSAGIEAVTNGTVDIGNSSRALKEEEKSAGIVENIVALDGIGVIVDPTNPVEDITMEQLVNIFNGTITNWSEVGGSDMAIVVIGRESGSGTRSAFEEIVGIEDQAAYAQEIDSTGAVVGKVESTPGAIGYVSLDVLGDSTAKALKLDGVEPTVDNIKSDTYALYRPFVMATKGEISEQRPEVQELFNFIASDEGKALIEQVGLISAN